MSKGMKKPSLSQQQDTSDARTSHVESKSMPQGDLKVWCFQRAFEQEVVPEDVEIQQLLLLEADARKAAQNSTETCV